MIKVTQIKANFISVQITESTILYFSYETLIAIRHHGQLHIIQNLWGPTTGKHLNYISEDKTIRIKQTELNQIVESILGNV